jgi:hypothetical protein
MDLRGRLDVFEHGHGNSLGRESLEEATMGRG